MKILKLAAPVFILATISFSAIAEATSERIQRSDGTVAYECFALACFENNGKELQRRFDSKLRYVKEHACKNTSASENKHCKESQEELQAIKQCANDICPTARCRKSSPTDDNKCWSAYFP